MTPYKRSIKTQDCLELWLIHVSVSVTEKLIANPSALKKNRRTSTEFFSEAYGKLVSV